MKRFHVHLRVHNLEESKAFYTALFKSPPTVTKTDYAKWMLDDPKVNFALSTNPAGESGSGIRHLGIQADNQTELKEVYAQMETAQGTIFPEGETTCCYAQSEKSWISDPQGVNWEVFYTHGEATVYGEGNNARPAPAIMDKWEGNDTAEVTKATKTDNCCGA